jgi:GNAT superfamily N-acetyltransferase
MADVSVRPARPLDAERVARVQLSTWRTAYADLLPEDALSVPEEQVAALWLRAVEVPPSPRHRLLVAMERIELVGFAALAPAEDDDLDAETAGELTALLVEPRWGRRGHGSRLLAAAVDTWRPEGVVTAVAWVWERDAASRSFLTSAGWEPDGAVRGLDTGPRVQRQLRLHTALSEA